MYTTKEIMAKYNLQTPRTDSTAFMAFCRRRGIILEFVKKENRTNYYNIVEEQCYNLPNEIWIQCRDLPEYEVSNQGRIKKQGVFYNAQINDNGYQVISTPDKKRHRVHRLILNSFNPKENAQNYVVDHINGIKTDNRLENLRWLISEENISINAINRKPLQIELTRIIEKYGYEQTLQILQNID